ncbi:MAG: GNAT family N-acetyltransferase [Rhodopila sp.]
MTSRHGFSLVRAGVEDSQALAAIHADAFPPEACWGANVFNLQLALPNVIGLTHSAAGLVLMRIAGDEAEVLTLAVRPAARRQRLGTALLEEALVQVACAGARVVFLEAAVKNTAALSLYHEFGFVQAGFRRRYYSDGSDATVLRLDLPRRNGS